MRSLITPLLWTAFFGACSAVPHLRDTARHDLTTSSDPTVSLSYGTFQGFSSAYDTESFLGIPYAQPPVGDLRLRHPVPPAPLTGVQNATAYGDACPQQSYTLPYYPGLDYSVLEFFVSHANASEDCLYINVIRPAGSEGQKLPVVVWLYGGAFTAGDASPWNGTDLVGRSATIDEPIIFVSFNYRVNAFGFLAGKEVQDAGLANIGLYDQDLAFQWVQQYISEFGGDPSRVTAWGQSAGASSIAAHMVGDNYKGQFQAGIMQSSSIPPIAPTASPKNQYYYDFIVNATNCTTASDTLDCLRQAPYDVFHDAVNQTPPMFSISGLNLTWGLSVDGVYLKKTLKQSTLDGELPTIPLIVTDVYDEGTLFSLYSTNITTSEFLPYIEKYFLNGATQDQLNQVAQAYPDDPALGSPFGTGDNYTLNGEFKRIAAFQGDWDMESARRQLLQNMAKKTGNLWSSLYERDSDLAIIGSVHLIDMPEYFGNSADPDYQGVDIIANFVTHLDPNAPAGAKTNAMSGVTWDKWTSNTTAPPLLLFSENTTLSLTTDDYRADAIELLTEIENSLGF
ncbi:Alpha/Beta hydrolase protein [Amylocystis lapponica]|nr:Alpha/Beta hydrolase protein [Amylocystis lapponica]